MSSKIMSADRPELYHWGLKLAEVVSLSATCGRRQVGCVLLNSRGHILATGYNGRAAGLVHCAGKNGRYCSGVNAESGTRLSECEAIHAEQNALLQCSDVHKIKTCLVTVSPCLTCAKLLMNTSTELIVFAERYAEDGLSLWEKAGRRWLQLTKTGHVADGSAPEDKPPLP